MEIRECGSVKTRRAPADWFTGTVWQDPIVEPKPPSRVAALLVRFEPGARTAWHTHPRRSDALCRQRLRPRAKLGRRDQDHSRR